jgi:hypothetical protein
MLLLSDWTNKSKKILDIQKKQELNDFVTEMAKKHVN